MKRLFWFVPVIGALGMTALMVTQQVKSAPAGKELREANTLPISRVILFSSGVGHFSRSAEIDGDTRVDLTFPEQDVNDLIKSMTLRDYSEKGRITAVTYDSHDPVERTLRSFAINLNNNPSFGQILNQARGETVEVVLTQNATGQPGTVQGKVLGIEVQKVQSKEGTVENEVLNLWCTEGMRAVKLSEVQRLRFTNPALENEMKRALETLALSHDSQKKAVSVHFSGEGKRKVEVGYVIENPIWKTSYRLVLDKEGKEAPYLQGWAVVENPTDEDWNSIQMALVSGRPISFQMNLYDPLYVKRPVVEPELFASLRPPTYSGALAKKSKSEDQESKQEREELAERVLNTKRDRANPWNAEKAKQESVNWEEGNDFFRTGPASKMRLGLSVDTAATASALGDYFQYVIDQPVSLGRQKSALLPIVSKDVGGQRVSIYNFAVQAKHPLLGLKFKNTSGMHLAQGPITVFEGSVYAGDTRVLDLQPGEERLISYAIDLGTEVSAKNGTNTSKITKVRAVKGIVHTTTLLREERLYDISNRSDKDRVLLIEHPNRKSQGFAFVGDNKPVEEAAEVYRFQMNVPAKKDLSYKVVEERSQGSSVQLTNNADDQIRYFLSLNEVSPALKAKLQEAMKQKAQWDGSRQEIGDVERRIKTISDDQTRIRQNLREVPKESEAYKTYLQKFDEQEKEMTSLHEGLKKLQGQEATLRAAYDNYLVNITAE